MRRWDGGAHHEAGGGGGGDCSTMMVMIIDVIHVQITNIRSNHTINKFTY